MQITTIRVTDRLRAAALRIAAHNKQLTDVVSEEGDTLRGRVLQVHAFKEGEAKQWIAVVEVSP